MLTNHEKGYHRDRSIVDIIGKYGAMDTDQITALYFNGIKNGKRIAQKRLQKLHEKGQLKRYRDAVDRPYCYYRGRKTELLEHQLGVNWVYVWLKSRLASWEDMKYFNPEEKYESLRPDAFVAILNSVTRKTLFYFIELDRAESGNEFDKITKYNDFYRSEKYLSTWWGGLAVGFPTILLVTTEEKRLKQIRERIQKENVNGLEFKVYLLDDIKGECMK